MMQIQNSWSEILAPEFEKQYMKDIFRFLKEEGKKGKTIYPNKENIFQALHSTDFSDVKVVILGQDPYHGVGQAHGLSFSVTDSVKIPPSLKNIFKEIQGNFPEKNQQDNTSGNLSSWAEQGVLLLNAILTVEAGKPASHRKIGWETFTDEIIQKISEKKSGVVFLLWGNFARTKKTFIDSSKHLILEAPHPSPFSAYKGFFGCGHFKAANAYLRKNGKPEIDW